MISMFRSRRWSSSLLFILIINFINLSVNFTEKDQELEDPVDTVSEMIFEWCLDGDAEAIPDNGTEQEDQQLKSLKVFFVSALDFLLIGESHYLSKTGGNYLTPFTPVFLALCSPPPDLD